MPVSFPTSNNAPTFPGTVYFNRNICRSFNQTIGTVLVSLSTQPCSEVVLYNSSPNTVLIYDNGYNTPDTSFVLPPSSERILRGITNTNVVSASAVAGTALVYYRTQFYSSNPITS